MKYRKQTRKIKKQHHLIDGLEKFLEKHVVPLESVEGIIPGRIEKSKAGKNTLEVRFQYETDSGVKLIARGPKVVQEVFVVTSDSDKLQNILKDFR